MDDTAVVFHSRLRVVPVCRAAVSPPPHPLRLRIMFLRLVSSVVDWHIENVCGGMGMHELVAGEFDSAAYVPRSQ